MKAPLILLSISVIAASSVAHAQSITVDQPPVPLAKSASNATTATTRGVAMKHELSLNWARVTGSRDANGKLVAQCTVEPNPIFAAIRKRAAASTTTQRKK